LAYGSKWRAGKGEVAVLAKRAIKADGTAFSLTFLIAVSIIGLILIPVLVVQPNIEDTQVSLRHSLVGVLYITICVLGVSAIFYPAKCNGMFRKSQNPLSQANKNSAALPIRGHHPDCQNYSANRIIVGSRAVCAACSGLLIGTAFALIGTASHFFAGLNIAWGGVWLLVIGEALMLLGLAQIKFAGYSKVFANAIFVIGSFVTLVEADLLGESVLVDLYALGLIAFMLWFRILLSEWNNKRTCQMCRSCFC
jgi:hypothetical protein